MATTITSTAVITDPVNVVLQRRFLERARQKCPYLAGTKPGSLALHAGSNTAKWRRYENLTPSTTALSEKTGSVSYPLRDGVTPSITDVTASVAKYGQYFLLNEEVDLAEPTEQEMELMDVLGISGGRSVNMLARNEMEDNSTAIRVGGASTDGTVVSKMTRNGVRYAVNTLERNVAEKFQPELLAGSTNYGTSPARDAFWGLCHPDVEQDIRDMQDFIAVERYATQTAIMPGEIGAVTGVRFIASEDATVDANSGGSLGSTGLRSTGGTSIDLYQTVIYGKNAYGTLGWGFEHIKEVYKANDQMPALQIIAKAAGSAGTLDPFNELRTIAYKVWFVAKVLNSNWGRVVRSGATDLNA